MSASETRKADLREAMREEAKRHSAEERRAASEQICERIKTQEVWKEADKVLLFVPTAHEPDISPLMRLGKRVSLPAFNATLGEYEAREGVDLVTGRFGILEPSNRAPVTDWGTVDLVLTPGVGFALDGARLGRGKGFYDRLLARIKAAKCGVCFDWQVLPIIPRDGHDVVMDYLATPTRWQRTQHS